MRSVGKKLILAYMPYGSMTHFYKVNYFSLQIFMKQTFYYIGMLERGYYLQ